MSRLSKSYHAGGELHRTVPPRKALPGSRRAVPTSRSAAVAVDPTHSGPTKSKRSTTVFRIAPRALRLRRSGIGTAPTTSSEPRLGPGTDLTEEVPPGRGASLPIDDHAFVGASVDGDAGHALVKVVRLFADASASWYFNDLCDNQNLDESDAMIRVAAMASLGFADVVEEQAKQLIDSSGPRRRGGCGPGFLVARFLLLLGFAATRANDAAAVYLQPRLCTGSCSSNAMPTTM